MSKLAFSSEEARRKKKKRFYSLLHFTHLQKRALCIKASLEKSTEVDK